MRPVLVVTVDVEEEGLFDKLALLKRAIVDAFGAAPTSYRAGRWGFDHTTVPVLERLRFTVDIST
jgi:hypothetical protein